MTMMIETRTRGWRAAGAAATTRRRQYERMYIRNGRFGDHRTAAATDRIAMMMKVVLMTRKQMGEVSERVTDPKRRQQPRTPKGTAPATDVSARTHHVNATSFFSWLLLLLQLLIFALVVEPQ